jgi:hypothetical protein
MQPNPLASSANTPNGGTLTTTRKMPRWALASLLSVLMLIAALWTQSYFSSVHDREDSIQGCLRSTLDRHVNARGWRIAEHARRASALLCGPGAASDMRASIRYSIIAASLESRTRPTLAGRQAFCEEAYPATSPIPWKA